MAQSEARAEEAAVLFFTSPLFIFLCFLPVKVVRKHPLRLWGTMTDAPEQAPCPRCSRSALTKGAGKCWKCEQGFSLEITAATFQEGELPDEKGNTGYSLFMYTGNNLWLTWEPRNIVEIGWLTWKRLSRVVFCSKNQLRASVAVTKFACSPENHSLFASSTTEHGK